jgi:TRAP-type C4-dicarboxylate transport system substrate-binding protein
LAAGYESKSGGNHIVGYTYYGQRHLTANKQVLKPEDMKGMKLRVPDAPLYMMFPRAVGANPTPIAFAEVYLALQNGTVDAQENPLPTIEAKKFYEVQKYTMLTGHITESLLTIVSGSAWGKLSADDRKLFEQVLWEASTRASNDILESENRMVADFEKAGRTIVKVDRKPFMQAVQKAVTAPDAPWSENPDDSPHGVERTLRWISGSKASGRWCVPPARAWARVARRRWCARASTW